MKDTQSTTKDRQSTRKDIVLQQIRFHYYTPDHLGNIREVVGGDGTLEQVTDYYPFGTPYYDGTGLNPSLQTRKFGGKELDLTHGYVNYDFGARGYNPLLGVWDRMDSRCEEFFQWSPYSYCFNNPLIFVDRNGERPSANEAAMMATYVYGGNDIETSRCLELLEKAKWHISTFETSIQMNYTGFGQNGLQTVLFQREKDGETEYAYVFAGTNSVEDVLEDIFQLLGGAPQYNMAIHNARTLSRELGDNELTFVGHSLGGGEAIASSMATGRAAITFNSAAVGKLTTYFQKLGKATNITNYRAIGSKVGIGNLRIGGDVLNNFQEKIGLRLPGKTIPIPMGPLPTHGISAFLKYKLPEPR